MEQKKMKRRKTVLLAAILAAVTLFHAGGGTVYASNSGTCGVNAQWTLEDGKLTVQGTGAIAEDAFAGRTDIRQVVIGDGITAIGDGAFSGCTALWLAVIPAGVTSIGTDAFEDTEVIVAGAEGSHASTYASQNGLSFKKEMDFSDVNESDWYYDDVAYVYYTGLMGNTSNTSFGVAQLFIRAQMAAVLQQFSQEPGMEYMPLFRDVSGSDWYGPGTTWANQVGILQGNADGYCEPVRNISRQEFVQMLYRYANYKGYGTSDRTDLDTYPDTGQVSDFAEEAVQWAVGTGILTGKNDGQLLAPLDEISQVEVAAMLSRFARMYVLQEA